MDDMDIKHPTDLRNDAQGQIIKLPQDWSGIKSSGALAQVDAYWHALRGSRLVPDRSDVDPRGIEGALSHSFIAERIAPGHARVRIAGQHLSDILGMEVRGMPLSALFEPTARDRLQGILRHVFDAPMVYRMQLASGASLGKPALNARMSIYPLRNDMGDISRALGCIVVDGDIGRAPRRFDITHAKEEILTAQTPDTAPVAKVHEEAAPMGLAEEPAAFEHTAVPYLRVVR
ncbi:PAS domain-containing protein [Primorskyibacter sp. S187A]|uniref:PAS domain-containing protein n=1 Tax=Primorskyibacter sp. S187A TaxID=3415130 RepID=UPI003C7CE26D